MPTRDTGKGCTRFDGSSQKQIFQHKTSMMNTNPHHINVNVLPLPQQATALTRQRQQFLAKQRRQDSDNRLPEPDDSLLYDYETIERIHRHARKNISSKEAPVRQKRRSKHEMTTEQRASRRHTLILPSTEQLEWLQRSASSGSSEGRNSPRRAGRRGRRRSIAATSTSANNNSTPTTPSNSPSNRRASMIAAGSQWELGALNAKFRLNW